MKKSTNLPRYAWVIDSAPAGNQKFVGVVGPRNHPPELAKELAEGKGVPFRLKTHDLEDEGGHTFYCGRMVAEGCQSYLDFDKFFLLGIRPMVELADMGGGNGEGTIDWTKSLTRDDYLELGRRAQARNAMAQK